MYLLAFLKFGRGIHREASFAQIVCSALKRRNSCRRSGDHTYREINFEAWRLPLG